MTMNRQPDDPIDLCHLGDVPTHVPEYFVRAQPRYDDEWARRGAVVMLAVILAWIALIWWVR